jgi:hypothetical protein
VNVEIAYQELIARVTWAIRERLPSELAALTAPGLHLPAPNAEDVHWFVNLERLIASQLNAACSVLLSFVGPSRVDTTATSGPKREIKHVRHRLAVVLEALDAPQEVVTDEARPLISETIRTRRTYAYQSALLATIPRHAPGEGILTVDLATTQPPQTLEGDKTRRIRVYTEWDVRQELRIPTPLYEER